MDTRIMNDALIGKCGWRMLKAEKNDIFYNLLKKKYMNRKSFEKVWSRPRKF
jgi:hypothetical protein